MILAQEAHGEALARHYNLETAPSISTARFKAAQMVATRIRARHGQMRETNPIPPENAFLLTVRMAQAEGVSINRAGKTLDHPIIKAGAVGLFDLRDEIRKRVSSEYDAIQFYIPSILLPELVEDSLENAELSSQIAREDDYIHALARSLVPLFGVKGRAITMYFDSVAALIATHVTRHWTNRSAHERKSAHGLSRWQVRRATDMLAEALVEGPDLTAIAAACDLTLERFLRGFRQELGNPPHAWLRIHRAQKARDLVLGTRDPLVSIAYACGFADQSHMTRSFVREFGVSPGAMRKSSPHPARVSLAGSACAAA